MYNKLYKIVSLVILGLFTPLLEAYAENPLRDPTQPLTYDDDVVTYAPNVNNDIAINATFAGTDHKVVMIGNHIFSIGEKISGSKIIAIDTNGITLKNDDGSESKVTMPYSNIKTPIKNNKEEKP